MQKFLGQVGKQILSIIKPNKKVGFVFSFLAVFIIVSASFLLVSTVYAQDTASIKSALLEFFGNIFLTLGGWFIQGTIFVLKFVIELASYNNYIQSGAVNLGWVLVRDVANMFFVIILMVIAFGTVLGLEQYAWQKLLVKFVLAAILVNFSRVICGVIIDAAQVFMMTFISAVAATAGGNLVNLFSLDKVLSFSQTTQPEAVQEWNMLAQAIASCIFAFTAMLVTGAYLVVLLGRIVGLWVLIILSPLAFVLNVIPQGQSYAKQWWSQFSNNVIVGPVLAFFLWLSFAVAGGANVHNEFASAPYSMSNSTLEQAGISQSANENVVGGLGDIMKWDNLASFIIAIALMLAGVKVAQQLGTAGAGALGAAAGAAGKFAMAASGVAAARWAVGKAKEGAQAGVKGVGKLAKLGAYKMPGIGGEAWKRRGEAIGARAALLGQKFQTMRDVGAKNLEKKGFFGGLAGRVLETGARKQKRVDFLKGAVESQKKIREDLWGAGVTPEGKLAGRMMKKAEIVHEEAERDKRNALARVKADLLDDEGRHEEADAVRANDEAVNLKELADRTAGLNESQLKTLAANIARERDEMLNRIGELTAQGKGKEAEKLREKMNSRGGINDRARGLMLSAMQKGHSTFGVVESTLAKNFSGTTGTEDAGLRFLSAVTGMDAKKNAADANGAFESSMSEAGRNAFLKNVQSLGLAMKKDGDAAPALIVSNGREVDERGRQRLVYGIGSGVGKLDSNGEERAAGARDVAGTDEKMLAYIAPKVEFREAADAEALLSRDKDRQVAGWDSVNIRSFRDRMKGAKTSGAVTSAASLSLRNQLNSDEGISPEMARALLSDLATDMKDNEIGFKEFMRQYDGLRRKAGVGDNEADWVGFHRQQIGKSPSSLTSMAPPAPRAPSPDGNEAETHRVQTDQNRTISEIIKNTGAYKSAMTGRGVSDESGSYSDGTLHYADAVRRKIDEWNRADNANYFNDPKQIEEAYRQVKEQIKQITKPKREIDELVSKALQEFREKSDKGDEAGAREVFKKFEELQKKQKKLGDEIEKEFNKFLGIK